ncbi:hypothetical protein CDG77_28265 [Nostoc sp. 'Peltigera membranacea cyanobiont' 213]|uniref:hypothetical protein n=1 Tax=Nostoc sp. 'Peltigera membranacea cyanobiont' 213 TaxID=2014530 RepID=UPI000B95A2FB|nr:hypothetical protein [Nostoc sp. 'Peltigera membranacea cyanobiont' 213]OYD87626.1 hypothetical protein CDG77_28265 [Nostoc sp. 'Peltigera membranacea cyanobiont' 213]
MTRATDIRRRAIELIEQLSEERLTAVVQLLEFLSEPSKFAASNPIELALVEVIQRRLAPNEQKRLEELRKRGEWGELTDMEHEELITYEDQLEHWRVERLEALMELARLRNMDLLTLNRQFVSESQLFHAV